MGQFEIADKIKVFVSSLCDEQKYKAVRAGIKELIESTGFATVYLFEQSLATSQSTEQDFLSKLADYDVCLFLIDNKDNISDGVLKEINEAKKLKKISFYIFCTEQRHEPTPIQEELKGAKGIHYLEITHFHEFIKIGSHSLINDIKDRYIDYCKGRLIREDPNVDSASIKEMNSWSSESLNKQLLKGIDKSKNYLLSVFIKQQGIINETSEFDESCKEFLKVLLGENEIKNFNTSLLLQELKSLQSDILYQAVELRWKAIQAYFNDNIILCIKHLQESIEIANKNSLPTWFKNDILIDLRNLNTIIHNMENQYSYDDAQKALDNNDEILYYPVLDRIDKEYHEKLLEQSFKNTTASPYTTNLGNNINTYLNLITNIFVIAVFNGSLTHLLMIIDRLLDMSLSLCEQFENWDFRILFTVIPYLPKISSFQEIFFLSERNNFDFLLFYKHPFCRSSIFTLKSSYLNPGKSRCLGEPFFPFFTPAVPQHSSTLNSL